MGDPSQNPPVPAGWRYMADKEVTPEMSKWAVQVLRGVDAYPMFSTTLTQIDNHVVMARVEWHPPDFQNNTNHRGVSLFAPKETTTAQTAPVQDEPAPDVTIQTDTEADGAAPTEPSPDVTEPNTT